MRAGLAVAAFLFALSPPSLSAQRPEQLRAGLQAPQVAAPARNPALTARADSSYWKTGFIVGSVVGTLLAAGVAGAYGADLDFRFVAISVAGGVLIGGVPGALIGGLFPKR